MPFLRNILGINRPSKAHQIVDYLRGIEQATHGSRATYVGNNRVLVKCVVKGRNIAYYVEADDRLLSPWFIITGTYETDLTNYFVRSLRKDSNCLDVGSNFGYFTCLMARFCPDGQIVGVEADQHVFEIVRDNIYINGFHNAQAIHAAAGDSSELITLHRRRTRSGNTSIIEVGQTLTDLLGEEPTIPFQVGGVRIDDLAGRFGGKIDFIKIDVEGAEPQVVAGARQTISSNPQLAIVMEWSPGQIQVAGFDLGDFLRSLEEQDLKPFDLEPQRMTSISYSELLNLPYRAGIVLTR